MATRSSFEPEMTSKRHNSSETKPVDAARSTRNDAHERLHGSKIRDFLRFFKLQVLAWRAPSERRKIAMHHNRRIAAYHILLHIVPLGAAISLLCLNWSSFFVGTEFSNATALQFAAKLHELLMQTSIVEVVLAIIHTQMMTGFVPLGALSTSMRASQLSSIWSLDFMSAVTSQVFVGAVLMIPRPGASRTAWSMTAYADVPAASLFPTRVNNTHGMNLDLDRFENGYQSLYYQSVYADGSGHYDSSSYNLDTPYVQRLMRISTTERYDHTAGSSDDEAFYSTTATMTIQPTALLMVHFELMQGWLLNATVSANIPHPVVVARCTALHMVSETLSDTMVTYTQDDGISQGNLSSVSELIGAYLRQGGSNDTMMYSLPPIWSQSPEPNSSALIGTFFDFDSARCNYLNLTYPYPISEMFTEEHRNSTRTCLGFRTCSISAFWATSTNEMTHIGGNRVAQTAPFPDSGFSNAVYGDAIIMNLTDIPSFNDASFTSYSGFGPFEPVLAAVFVTALANIPNQDALGQFKPILVESPSFDFELIQYGYGYNTSPASVRLSLAVITTYCVVIIGFILYIFFTGHTSTAWNSAIELALLALQSKGPDHLGHTSVGVESLETFRQAVGIRVNDEEELELVFANDKDIETMGLRKIVPNKAY
ncbi:hypothetical protein K458DRAFT_381971 [Lentithecium fluviatile CBS 122367]|uniref:Uncharacterized protein n=1 Tax=Lentithecium fluviatile CBS 122367 TaxID=1168545 RepID=A0A6G1JPV2_9PLEO|nr:hypothetical protein K458DRAFT_381971 [Lentithecium fluviatile CBS 122367]